MKLFTLLHLSSYPDFPGSLCLFSGISMQQYSWKLISPLSSISAGFSLAWINSGYMHCVSRQSKISHIGCSLSISSWTDCLVWQQKQAPRTRFVDRVSCLYTERVSPFLPGHRDRWQARHFRFSDKCGSHSGHKLQEVFRGSFLHTSRGLLPRTLLTS